MGMMDKKEQFVAVIHEWNIPNRPKRGDARKARRSQKFWTEKMYEEAESAYRKQQIAERKEKKSNEDAAASREYRKQFGHVAPRANYYYYDGN